VRAYNQCVTICNILIKADRLNRKVMCWFYALVFLVLIASAYPTATGADAPFAIPIKNQALVFAFMVTGTPPTETCTPTVTVTPVASVVDILKFETVATSVQIDTDGAVVTGRVNVIGSVVSSAFDHYELEYTETGKDAWVKFAEGEAQITNGVLGTLDPTMMLNGQYNIRLRLYETGGEYWGVNSGSFTIEGNMKIGNFTLSFTDLSVPVAGIPMDINRSYDSRQKTKGDFGYRWNLSISNIKVQESCDQGQSWSINYDPLLFSVGLLKIKPKRSHIVSVAMPDGSVYRFEALVTPNKNLKGLNSHDFTVKYESIGRVKGTLKALDQGPAVYGTGEVPGDIEWIDLYSDTLYDPILSSNYSNT